MANEQPSFYSTLNEVNLFKQRTKKFVYTNNCIYKLLILQTETSFLP